MNTETKLWNKNFITYIIAYEFQQIGDALLRFAIPVYILVVTNDPALLGTVLTLSWLPFALFTPLGGVLADRLNKRHVISFCNFLVAVAIGIYLLLTGNMDNTLLLSIVMLLVTTMLQSIQSSSFETAVYSLIPMDELLKANSVTWILMIGSGIIVPIISGFMLTHLGLTTIVYTSMALFLIASLLNLFLKIPFTKPEQTTGLLNSIAVDMKMSFQFISEQEVFKRATIALVLYSLLLSPIASILPSVFINTILEMSKTRLGFAQGVIAMGGICGVLLLGKLGRKINITKLTHLLVVSAITLILTIAAFMLVSNNQLAYMIITAGFLFINTLMVMFSLNYFTYLGQNTPEEIVGKIMAFAMTVMLGVWTIASFLVGRFFNLFSNNLPVAGLILPVIVLIFSSATVVKKENVKLGMTE